MRQLNLSSRNRFNGRGVIEEFSVYSMGGVYTNYSCVSVEVTSGMVVPLPQKMVCIVHTRVTCLSVAVHSIYKNRVTFRARCIVARIHMHACSHGRSAVKLTNRSCLILLFIPSRISKPIFSESHHVPLTNPGYSRKHDGGFYTT